MNGKFYVIKECLKFKIKCIYIDVDVWFFKIIINFFVEWIVFSGWDINSLYYYLKLIGFF